MTTWKLSVKVLSPLHIGAGVELRQGFDYVIFNGKTCRLNEDAVLEAKQGGLIRRRDGTYPLPGELLSSADMENDGLFRYILPGSPRSRKADSRLQACIKDVYDRPYIPGSSLKGAMRTALAWTGWKEVKPKWDSRTLGRRREWAGQGLERQIFGENPNLDLLKALHVGDCFGPQQPGGRLAVINAQVLTRRSAGSPIELEAILGDTAFHGSLTIDEHLFTPEAERRLHLGNRRHWLEELMPRIQAHSHVRIEELLAWFETQEEGQRIASFYRQLADVRLDDRRALMQLGWGTGWDGKTFGSHLQQDARQFEQIIQDYRLQRRTPNAPSRRAGDPFPRSKRAVMRSKDGIDSPIAPFGWVLLEIEET